jgi:hypothetical protein
VRTGPIERQAQVFLRDVGFEGAPATLTRLGDAGADTVLLVLTERGTDQIRRLAEAVL